MNSQNLQSRFAASALVVLSSCLLTVQAIDAANPPAQGPPPASSKAQSLQVSDLTSVVQAVVTGTVDKENANLANNNSHRAFIQVSPIVPQTPFMTTTNYHNQPNEFIAEITYNLTYQVSQIQVNTFLGWISYPFTRTLTQQIDVFHGCEGWSTGSGVISSTIFAGPLFLQGDSIAEEAINALLLDEIPQYVDSQINSALGAFATGSSNLPNGAPCRSLGVSTIAAGNSADLVTYDPPVRQGPGSVPPPNITVRVTKVHRLQVLDSNNQPVYNPSEFPEIDIYAGFTHLLLDVPPMIQGQTVTLTTNNTLETPIPPNPELLVLIANVSSGNDDVNADYAFRTFGATSGFGNGTEVMYTPKHWIQTGRQPGAKQVSVTAPGYELTFEISTPGALTAP
jgi:hypothetical protein